MKVPFSHLQDQFANPEELLQEIRRLILSGSFTLGPDVERFEKSFAKICGTPFAVGVGNGTDALLLSLRVLGVGIGDEVITAPNTFIATVGAIHAVGAKPVFADVTPSFNLDPEKIEGVLSPKTKAILPVHLTGEPADMDPILAIADKHHLDVIEDACQAIAASYKGRPVGGMGVLAAFSLHPLKNINVWGDGGVITTHSKEYDLKLRLLRNHGLKTRDEVEILGLNSRLDSLQAIVGNWMLKQIDGITKRRIENAGLYDEALSDLEGYVQIPPRRQDVKRVFHLYCIEVLDRDKLLTYLNERGIEAKVHYPIPLHLQKALRHLSYKKGDFPIAERQSERLLTLPVHQHLKSEQLEYVCQTIKEFYKQ